MSEKNPILFCIGTNHESAGLDFRETLFLSREDIDVALPRVVAKHKIQEVFVLSTCNRLEIYGVLEHPEVTQHHLKEIFIDLQRFSPSPKAELDEEIKHRSYSHVQKEAARHAFSVAAGLDSLVLGETQIAGQFKLAAQLAQENGTLGPVLKRLTQEAFSASKKVRTHTDIGKKPVSISHAAIDLANRVYGNIKDCNVLIVGAGEMAEVAAKYLLKYQPQQLFVCNRTLARAEQLVEKVGIGIPYPWDEFHNILPQADVVISCTASNEIVIDKARVLRSQQQRNHKPQFLIDIALPRDIDPACSTLEDVYVFDIDDLKQVVGENFEERRRAAEQGKHIVVENAHAFEKWLNNLSLKPALSHFREYLDSLTAQELQKSLSKSPLNALDTKQQQALEALLKSIVQKMSADAGRTVHAPPLGYSPENLADALKTLFPMDKNG